MELTYWYKASLLRFRRTDLRIEDIENTYGFSLPPVFRSFVLTFDDLRGDIYRDAEGNFQTLTYFEYHARLLGGRNLMFENFIELENMFKYCKNSDVWEENEAIPITSHSHGGTILLGLSGDKTDKLFYEYGNGLQFIEETVYSFVKRLNCVIDYDGDTSRLYKNWGEDFWRVREQMK